MVGMGPEDARTDGGQALYSNSTGSYNTANGETFPLVVATPNAVVRGAGPSNTVLYGSGGASLYDARKLRALGGVPEAYAPATDDELLTWEVTSLGGEARTGKPAMHMDAESQKF